MEHILIMTKEEATRATKPKFNGFMNGHGPHKNKKKYDRKDKSWKNEIHY